MSRLELAIEADERFHAGALSRRKRNNLVAGPHRPAGNPPRKAAEACTRTNNGLHRKPQSAGFGRTLYRNRFKVLQHRWAGIPGHVLAACYKVVALECAHWDALDERNAQVRSKYGKVIPQPQKNVFAVADEVHLVYSGEYVRESQ